MFTTVGMMSMANPKEYCSTHDYVMLFEKFFEPQVTSGMLSGFESFSTVVWCEFVPQSEYAQYQEEKETIKRGGMLDYTAVVASIPKDAKSLKQAESLYQKGLKKHSPHKAYEAMHAAAQLGSPMAKVEEARFFFSTKNYGSHWLGNVDQSYARQLVDEAILSDDPKVWEDAKEMLSEKGKAYIAWKKGETEAFPYRYMREYKGQDVARQIMRDTYKYVYEYPNAEIQAMVKEAEDGDLLAKKKLALTLWHGLNTPANKTEAVKWMRMLDNSSDNQMQDYLIMAKGEGLYDREIPEKWYKHNHSSVLVAAAEAGNPEAIRAKNANAEVRKQEEDALMGLASLVTAYIKVKSALSSSGGGDSYTSDSSSSSESDSSDDTRSSNSGVDVEKIGMPSYKFTTEWQTAMLREKVSGETGENQVRDIEFEDGKYEGRLWRVIGSNGYWVTGDKRYRTLDDAIIAEYVYQKYGKRREKGRW